MTIELYFALGFLGLFVTAMGIIFFKVIKGKVCYDSGEDEQPVTESVEPAVEVSLLINRRLDCNFCLYNPARYVCFGKIGEEVYVCDFCYLKGVRAANEPVDMHFIIEDEYLEQFILGIEPEK